jgi:hypothetical protein
MGNILLTLLRFHIEALYTYNKAKWGKRMDNEAINSRKMRDSFA